MTHTLKISDTLYNKLRESARRRGLSDIEHLLEIWQTHEDERLYRQKVVRQIDTLRERLFNQYGQMADSVQLIREDRQR